MATAPLSELLFTWRAAARALDRAEPGAASHAARLEVVHAWIAYQDAALPRDNGEFLLVADDERRYVGATSGVRDVLGYRPTEIVGLHIDELAAPDLVGSVGTQWTEFLADGSFKGEFALRSADGRFVALRYHSQANHPIPGFHVSRLWPADATAQPAPRRQRELAGNSA